MDTSGRLRQQWENVYYLKAESSVTSMPFGDTLFSGFVINSAEELIDLFNKCSCINYRLKNGLDCQPNKISSLLNLQ